MQFRAKIDTPWCKSGDVYIPNLCEFDPRKFPDLFEEIREKSNLEKWSGVLIELGVCSTIDRVNQLAKFLDANGYDSKNAFLKVLSDEDKYVAA